MKALFLGRNIPCEFKFHGYLSVVVLSVLHEVVRVYPVVEPQHMISRLQDGIALLELIPGDLRADLLLKMK